MLNIKFTYEGNGYIYNQSVKPGTKPDEVILYLKDTYIKEEPKERNEENK